MAKQVSKDMLISELLEVDPGIVPIRVFDTCKFL